MSDRLTPLPHLIKSIRSRNWTLAGAIMEWVDNSLQHGLAKTVAIVIDNAKGVAVIDNGIGVDDINRVFTLGDASAYGDLSQIGQYGVGATDAMIYLGEVAIVKTVRDGHLHSKVVNWLSVETSGLWPVRYDGKGRPAKEDEAGTTVVVKGLFKHYTLSTSEKLGKELGLVFAPTLRKGTKIKLIHRLATRGAEQKIMIEPFVPANITNATTISGEIETSSGPLRWNGWAGLSKSLLERFNGVHISFAHRVIEMTRDPFLGASAPTLYVEVQLDEMTPWKYQLSDHKDRVVRHRDELVESVHRAILPLLVKASQMATDIAFREMTAEIEVSINKALKRVGLLHIGEDAPGEILVPDINGVETGVIIDRPDNPPDKIFEPEDEGTPAKDQKRPTGIRVEYIERVTLEGRAFAWDIVGKLMTIKLEKETFSKILGWPPKFRNNHTMHMVLAFLSHAVEIMYWDESHRLKKAVTPKLFEQIELWAQQPGKIAPYFYAHMMNEMGITVEESQTNGE